MNCPSSDEIIGFVDGEASINAGKALALHLDSCSRCRGSAERVRGLAQQIGRAVGPGRPDPAFVAEVLARTAVEPAPRPLLGLALLGGALAAALALMLVLPRSALDPPVARGSLAGDGPEALARRLGVLVSSEGRWLEPGARFVAEEGLRFRVANRSHSERFLLLFGVDRAGTVHWFHPAYLSARDDPSSIPVPATPEVRDLAEVVAPDGAAEGRFVIVALFTEQPVRVKEVEALLSNRPTVAPGAVLERRWPKARVQQLEVEVAP
jgi:hypothetical protein